MVRKKLDPRIRALVENGVKTRHRSMFVVVGDRGRDQVVNLHYMLSKAVVRSRPSVLWCYKKTLGFATGAKAYHQTQEKRRGPSSQRQEKDDPFKTFVSTTDIRYVFYSETHRVLGTTFGMLVLQDFEAMTPNLLARTVETVEGGGVITILLRTMDSLRQLHALAMDAHKRFRTEGTSADDPVARFNERFLLSLADCNSCLVVDDELNVLPISSHARTLAAIPGSVDQDGAAVSGVAESAELRDLKESLRDVQPAGSLVRIATTVDQARAALLFLDAIGEKSLRSTVSLTAARGRGKSAALGMAIAGAVASGYSNIFVTAPSPENLKTLFDFVLRGFDAMGYRDKADYDVVQATNPEFGKAVVRINIFRAHRQTVQYIAPSDAHKLGQAELLVIDEAAAIPLPMVNALLGPYLVFLSSTVNGYEGTGRSLSLKLIQKLREQNAPGKSANASARQLKELTLEEPIRYAAGDPVEHWLNKLLCLDAATTLPPIAGGCPHPSQCQLYYVSRDTLFSFHRQSEEFLQRVIGLFVSSHYKNSPNDLQLISDAPAHHLFVLLGPVTDTKAIPDVLAAVHLSMEGAISRESVMKSIGRGQRAAGDLIPWTVSQQFQDSDFPSLSGARVVRIATHPNAQSMGYGSRILQLLTKYYQGEITSIDEHADGDADGAAAEPEEETDEKGVTPPPPEKSDEDLAISVDGKETDKDKDGQPSSSKLLTEKIQPRTGLPPLLVPLQQRPCEHLHYLGVAYGVSPTLYTFWSRNGFQPVYLRLTANDVTGEHSCIMIKKLKGEALGVSTSDNWLKEFVADFRRRLTALMSFEFRSMPVALPTNVFIPDIVAASRDPGLCSNTALSRSEIRTLFTEFDRRRLDSYAANLVDYHVVLDLVPTLSRLVFTGRIPIGFSAHQYSTLLGVGLQHRVVDDVAKDLGIEVNQLLANFNKAMRKIAAWLRRVAEKEVEGELSLPPAEEASEAADSKAPVAVNPVAMSLDDDLADAEERANARMSGKATVDDDDMVEGAGQDAEGGNGGEEEGEEELAKKERLAKALGVAHCKISHVDALEESAAKLKGAIPSIVSFKVGTKPLGATPQKGGKRNRPYGGGGGHSSGKHPRR